LNADPLSGTLQHKVLGVPLKADGPHIRSEAIMQKLLRRIRGAIGMGLTWAVAWSIVGLVPRWVFGFNADAPFPLIFGVLGFGAGVIFAAVLSLTESRRRFDQMSLSRFAGGGAMGGLILSALFAKASSLDWGDVVLIAPAFTVACAVCASGSLALARRAEMRQLADIRRNTVEAELTDAEKRRLTT
jgi:hypothetical protein